MYPFIGEICIFPYNFAPRDFLDCSGQLLQIAQNTALFSLVGTTYGGDGQTTFGVPNAQGRTVMNWGNGPGLSTRTWGEYGGYESVTLTAAQMPSHSHMLRYSPTPEYQSPEGRYYSTHQFNNFRSDANTILSSTSIGNNGSNQPHNNMQPYLTLRFCIATSGYYPSRKEEITGGNHEK
ncbi:MAG: phage tail protein [Candidatus Delongbacteria bacterium]|nr:phage tail protein [Candidatus Delongbacteria bacterium]